jgi:hypothetical protein
MCAFLVLPQCSDFQSQKTDSGRPPDAAMANGHHRGNALPFEHQIGGKQHRPSDTEAKQAKYKAKTFMLPVDRSGCVFKPVTPGLRGQLESTFYRLMFEPLAAEKGHFDPPLACPQLAVVSVCRQLLPFLPPYFGTASLSDADEPASGACTLEILCM